MFGKGNHRQQEAGGGKKMVKQTSVPKKQSQQQQQQQQQQSKNEPFSLGWEVPQNNLRGQQEITGKVGVGYNKDDYQKMQQDEIQQNKQNHKSNSQQRVGKQTYQPAGQNIFNIENGQKLETENAKGYGNFYNLDKGQLKKKQEEETQKQGYGQFYERNQYGDFTNIPRPAQQLKR